MSLSLLANLATAQEEREAPTEEDIAEIEAQIAAYENTTFVAPLSPQEDEIQRAEALLASELTPIDPAAILADQAAVDAYRVAYMQAQQAAQKIYDTQADFDALRALTPEQAEAAFPEGGYDVALNDASDAAYWAIEDGASAATNLDEARQRVAGDRPLTDFDIEQIDTLLGL